MWHNFVKVGGNWKNAISRRYDHAYNRRVKFELKYLSRWENIALELWGWYIFLTHTVQLLELLKVRNLSADRTLAVYRGDVAQSLCKKAALTTRVVLGCQRPNFVQIRWKLWPCVRYGKHRFISFHSLADTKSMTNTQAAKMRKKAKTINYATQ